jgi:hypothetical protein
VADHLVSSLAPLPEQEQDSEDNNPNINAHQSRPAAPFAIEQLWLSLRPRRDMTGAGGLCIFVVALFAFADFNWLIANGWPSC